MAGKSTYLRQNAHHRRAGADGQLRARPRRAHLGVVDRLFSRVGAADDLARGRSTFMVEMIEAAAILNQATPRSLVILDEIGRGTATFDGLSIAWAAIEHLHEANRCRALFATHFHELTALAAPAAAPRDGDGEGDGVPGRRRVPARGGARHRGPQLRHPGRQARGPAAAPSSTRARIILDELEASDRQARCERLIDDLPLFAAASRAAAPAATAGPDPLRESLAGLDPDQMSPREALDALYRLKQASS